MPKKPNSINKDLENKVNKIKGLTQYHNLPKDELYEVAQKMIDNQETKDKDLLDIEMYFDNKAEKKAASKLLKKYMDNYSIESVSDKNTLVQLIFLEVLFLRFMKQANKCDKEDKATPSQLVDTIHKNIREISGLKEQLGILKSEKSGVVDQLAVLKKKYDLWLEENQASRQFICSACGQMTLLRIDISHYEKYNKNPFFKDRILGNLALVELYQKGTITEDDVAKVLDTSKYYTSWLISKWDLNKKIEQQETLQIEESENLEENIEKTVEKQE